MKLPTTALVPGAALALVACGGAVNAPGPQAPALPPLAAEHASHAPVVDLGAALHVGADVAPAVGALALVARHGDVRVSHGHVRDGVGAAELIAYLQADADSYLDPDGDGGADTVPIPGGLVFRFGPAPPTVRVAHGTAPELIDETVRVVQTINAYLPGDWQLAFGREPAPGAPSEAPAGAIVVEFAPQEDWPESDVEPVEEHIGLALPRYEIVPTGDPASPFAIRIVAGHVLVDPGRTGGAERPGVIAHEIIHLLGRGHVDPARFPGTLMLDGGGGAQVSPHILRPLDREALLAVYGRLGPGTTPSSIAEDLGSWSDTSVHVHGTLGIPGGDVEFGAALRNGATEPWAFGPAPHANPEDNPELAGSVTWTGRLLGLTPRAEAVAGAAALSLDLPTLTGTMDFTGLEHWPADAAPGAVGSGSAWHDGDLRYDIEVRGNTFHRTGGDAGTVTGAFFGPAHEAMGGVVEREDLDAGFAGRRQP